MSVNEYLFIFTIGPVQSFIAEARRTADLYAGSKILSQLSAAAAKKITEPHELIFPHPDTLQGKTSAPNKLVAVLKIDDGQDAGLAIEAVANDARKAAEASWQHMASVALFELGLQDSKFHPLWERQKQNSLEFYWVALPVTGDYMQTYREANAALDARKRARLFVQSAEDGLKDSLSGLRQALRTHTEPSVEFWQKIRLSKPENARRVKKYERLDTIAAIKRFGVESDNYPSVSTIASMDFVHGLEPADKERLIDKINTTNQFYTVNDFGRGFPYDGDLLYTSTYQTQRLEASYDTTRIENTRPVVDELRRLHNKMGAPTPYYAILIMDGDSMGKHLSSCHSKMQHQNISKRLAEFASSMDMLIQQHHGCLVYAGGDDVLAFLPLSTVLTAAATINQHFQQYFADWQEMGQAFPFTMSAGIAVVHHMSPLDWALTEARAAERVAKNKYNRNVIVMRLLKRSGDSRQMGGRWETVAMVQSLQDYFKEERLASRLAHDLLEQAVVTTAVPDAYLSTIKLMLKRHKTKDRQKAFTEAEMARLTNTLGQWVADHKDIVPRKAGTEQSLTELGLWLTFARFAAQGGRDE